MTAARVALVHDYLLVARGAERTFLQLAAEWPQAPIQTLLWDSEAMGPRLRGRTVRASRLQLLPVSQSRFRVLLPLLPWAAEGLDVTGAEVVVSSSSAFAHGVRPDPGAVHVCYCHSPFRYAWHERARALEEAPRPLRRLLGLMLDRIRRWDEAAAARTQTRYVANSRITQRRIADYWGRESEVVHPPVEVARFSSGTPEDYLVTVCELVRHKRIDVAIQAARLAGMPLKVVGTGPDEARLRALAGPDVEFLGRLPDERLESVLARSLALVMPNVEEFGIAAVEAQAAGRPVVAVDEGGARETVRDGVTGVLVPGGGVDAMAEALRSTHFDRFDPHDARANAERFAPEAFRAKMRAAVDLAVSRRSE